MTLGTGIAVGALILGVCYIVAVLIAIKKIDDITKEDK